VFSSLTSAALSLALGLALLVAQVGVVAADAPPDYLDDRSTAEQVMASYASAVNRQEYLRAYSYWETGASQLPPFDQFEQGFAATASLQLTTGTSESDVGAGQLYWRLPVTLVSTMTDNSLQTFVGCYQLHLARPQFQAQPPFRPMAIQRANVQQVDNDADTGALMAQSCALL
jgi:hypothetical protein